MKKTKVFLLRRWYMVGGAALVLAAAIFYVVNYPAAVSASHTVAAVWYAVGQCAIKSNSAVFSIGTSVTASCSRA